MQTQHELVPVTFHNDTIYYVEKDGEQYVPLRPIIENMGLAWEPQYPKLQDNAVRWGVTIRVTPSVA